MFQLAFDSIAPAGAATTAKADASDDDALEPEEEEVLEAAISARSSLAKVVTEVNRRLEAIAESGTQSGLATHREWFTTTRREAHGFGLTALATRSHSPTATTILKARYLTHLYTQATVHLR